jgi:hypothetical protein
VLCILVWTQRLSTPATRPASCPLLHPSCHLLCVQHRKIATTLHSGRLLELVLRRCRWHTSAAAVQRASELPWGRHWALHMQELAAAAAAAALPRRL